MEYKCDLIADEIWERARAGESLPAETVEHLDECPKCRRVAAEARAVVPMMQVAASCVPDAPDCRSAVMERISARPFWRSAWAYAAVSVLLVVVIVTGWLAMRSGADKQQMAGEPKPAGQERFVKPQAAPEAQPETPKPERPSAPVIEKSPKIERPKRIHLLPRQRPTQLVKHAPSKQEPDKHEMSAALDPEEVVTFDDEPVAAVAVSWPTVGDQVMPASYSYTDTDVSTGAVTFCCVERSADTIYVNLESNAPGDIPGKGA